MAEVVKPMASEHKRIVERLEALEKSALPRDNVEERLGWHVDRMNRLDARLQAAESMLCSDGRRLDKIEARLSSKPDDFGGVTSTGAPKRERRFMVVKDRGLAFSREDGYVRRCAAANPACVPPMLFERLEDAGEIIRLLDLQDAEIEPVEAIERDGRLIEARYA